MKCYHCLNEFTPEDARNENMAPYFVSGMTEVAAAHMECPSVEPVRFKWYVYDNSEGSEIVDYLTDSGRAISQSRGSEPIPSHVAETIADSLRHAEVSLYLEYNPDSEEVIFVRAEMDL